MEDKNAEFSVMSGVLKYGRAGFSEVRDLVSANCFTDIKYRAMYELAEKILEKQEKIDAASLISAASTMKVSHVVDTPTIENAYNHHVELDSLRELAKKVRRLDIIRGAKMAARQSHDAVAKLTGDETLSKILGALENHIFAYSNSIGQDDEGIRRLFDKVEAHIKHLEENPCDVVGISTSFPTLDRAMGYGMKRGSVTMFGARTGVGKSMLGANIAKFNAAQGIPILILDTEMSEEDNIERYLSNQAMVNQDSITRGTFGQNKEMRLKVYDAGSKLKELPIFYKNVAGMQMEEIISLCRRWIMMEVGVHAGKCEDCLIVYDYFKLTNTDQLKSLSEHEALGYQITQLTDFCNKYGATAVTFVQLNRQGISVEDLSVISQSDRLGWLAANVVLFKEKTPEEIQECGEKWGNTKLIPLKTRFGPGLPLGDQIFTQKNGQYAIIREVGSRLEMLKEKHDEDDGEEDSSGD